MGVMARKTFRAVFFGGGLFVLWLFAVWPPPVWFRTHWSAETAFQRMRRSGGPAVGRSDQESKHRNTVRSSWFGSGRPAARPPDRLYHPVPLDSTSDWLPQALMTGEDQRFRDHHWIDWV